MYDALGLEGTRVLLISIMVALGAGGIAALFTALFWPRRWKLPYSAEVGFVALLVGLLFYAEYSSTKTYTAYESLLPAVSGEGGGSTPPSGERFDREVTVLAFQWGFLFYDEEGNASRNAVKVMPGERVLFRILTNDVIHGFNIPVARLTAELEPGGVNYLWIRAPEATGRYLIQCLNYCGLGHAQMKAWLVVGDIEEGGEEA